MYFKKIKGKQHLFLGKDFILTKEKTLVRARAKSNAPRYVHNATYVTEVSKINLISKIKVLFEVWRFMKK
jgi:hypothetical protein